MPAAVAKYEKRRARFLEEAKKALAENASGRLPYPELMARLGTELTRFRGKNPLRLKLKAFLKGLDT